MCQVLSRS